jgi:hypothetical protein
LTVGASILLIAHPDRRGLARRSVLFSHTLVCVDVVPLVAPARREPVDRVDAEPPEQLPATEGGSDSSAEGGSLLDSHLSPTSSYRDGQRVSASGASATVAAGALVSWVSWALETLPPLCS